MLVYLICILYLLSYTLAHNCSNTCEYYDNGISTNYTCDHFSNTCAELEETFGCDCSGCKCDSSYDDDDDHDQEDGHDIQGIILIISLLVTLCSPCCCCAGINHGKNSRDILKKANSPTINNNYQLVNQHSHDDKFNYATPIIRKKGNNLTNYPIAVDITSNLIKKFDDEVSVSENVVVNIHEARQKLIDYNLFRLQHKEYNDNQKQLQKMEKPYEFKIYEVKIQRYWIDKSIPFAMISYKATLKETIEGVNFLLCVIDILISHGYKFCWWDWLVIHPEEIIKDDEKKEIISEKYIYKQSEFEKAMFWATDNAFVLAIVWPNIMTEGVDYLFRPWCCAELLKAISHQKYLIFCNNNYQNSDEYFMKLHESTTLMLKENQTARRFQIPFIIGLWVWGILAIVGFLSKGALFIIAISFMFGCYPFVAVLIYNKFNQMLLPDVNPYTPFKALQMLEDQYDPVDDIFYTYNTQKKKYSNEIKVSLLQRMSYLNGLLWDLGDSPSCGKILGLKSSDYTFQQGTMSIIAKWSTCKAIFPFFYSNENPTINIKSFIRKREILENACWLNNIAGAGEWSFVDSVSGSFVGRTTLFLSKPLTWSSENFWLISIILSPPIINDYFSFILIKYPSTVQLIHSLLNDTTVIDGKINKGNLRFAIHVYYWLSCFLSITYIKYLIDIILPLEIIKVNSYYVSFELLDFIPRFLLSRGYLTIVGNTRNLSIIYKECILPYHFIFVLFSILFMDYSDMSLAIKFLLIIIYQQSFRWIYFVKGNFFGSLIKIA